MHWTGWIHFSLFGHIGNVLFNMDLLYRSLRYSESILLQLEYLLGSNSLVYLNNIAFIHLELK